MVFYTSRATFAIIMFGLLAVLCHGKKSELKINVVHECHGDRYKRIDIVVRNVTFSRTSDSKNVMVSGTINVKKDLTDLFLKVKVSRCVTEDINSCSEYVTLNCTHLCQVLGLKFMVWSTIVKNIKDFPRKCPIPKGRYEMDNAYLDLGKVHDTMALPNGNWMATLNFYNKEELVFCHYALATIKPERKRKTQNKQGS